MKRIGDNIQEWMQHCDLKGQPLGPAVSQQLSVLPDSLGEEQAEEQSLMRTKTLSLQSKLWHDHRLTSSHAVMVKALQKFPLQCRLIARQSTIQLLRP